MRGILDFQCALLVLTPVTLAGITATVDKLDPSDGFPMPPDHLVMIDLAIGVTPDDPWVFAGIVARPSNGAALHYEYDPNGDPLVVAPGTDNRFTTFFSRPRGRNDDGRFLTEASVSIIGAFFGGASAIFSPSLLDVAYQELLPPGGGDGYIARIALDLSGVTDPAFRTDSPNIVVATTPPPGSLVLLESVRDRGGATIVDTLDLEFFIIDWGVYGIPEPASVTLLIAGVAMLRRVTRSG